MGRNKTTKFSDPRGMSLRLYADIFDSHAWAALGPFDVLAYLALLRELKSFNNGDLSLPLSRAKRCGISHHVTLARSLRALRAVGLIAITRKGGSAKGGQRLATLYRFTDRECYDVPAKHIEARPATNEWKHVTSREHGASLIAEAEAKTKTLGHPVTDTTSPNVLVKAKTKTRRDTWNDGLGHFVTMAKSGAKPIPARVSGDIDAAPKKASHRTPRVPPMHIATPVAVSAAVDGERIARPAGTTSPRRSIKARIVEALLSGPKTSPELDALLGTSAAPHVRKRMVLDGIAYTVMAERIPPVPGRSGFGARYTLVARAN